MSVVIEAFGPNPTPDLLAEIGRVYQQAFGSTDDQTEAFVSGQLTRHLGYPGFLGCIARSGDRIVGFVYGYTDRPGQWWHDQVSPAFEAAGLGWWLENAFDFTELAVDPAMQGHGIGGLLHDAVLADLPHATAVLSTAARPSNALGLYRARGWQPVVEDFRYAPGGDPIVLMGLRLPPTPGANS